MLVFHFLEKMIADQIIEKLAGQEPAASVSKTLLKKNVFDKEALKKQNIR